MVGRELPRDRRGEAPRSNRTGEFWKKRSAALIGHEICGVSSAPAAFFQVSRRFGRARLGRPRLAETRRHLQNVFVQKNTEWRACRLARPPTKESSSALKLASAMHDSRVEIVNARDGSKSRSNFSHSGSYSMIHPPVSGVTLARRPSSSASITWDCCLPFTQMLVYQFPIAG